ncbi:MAG: hypothetical protein FJX89_06020 [Bacteroidetes bacterium]|nr:hypothetical protein [Bacteroidota bacterium]
MKQLVVFLFVSATIYACTNTSEKINTVVNTSSCVKEGPEVDLMKKALTAYCNGDWPTFATCFSDSALSYHNADTVGTKMTDRIEMFKKQRESLGETVDPGNPNLEVVTVDSKNERYKDYKWGHAWVRFTRTAKTGEKKSTLTFASFAIKNGKIDWEQVIYDTK